VIELGVNIDHVATLREARKGTVPSITEAAKICEDAGAHQITVHLRQDRRHIQDHDVTDLKEILKLRLNLEMAAVPEIINIAHQLKPHTVCLVPENRQEITTEGGLDVAAQQQHLTDVVTSMHQNDIKVSMFIDPDEHQVDASNATGADYVELHTGAYANAKGPKTVTELDRLHRAAKHVAQTNMRFHAGHGLSIQNLEPVARIPNLREVNIGHDIIARAVFIGLDNAVKEILDILKDV
jgi:pyridoxine 5-phosphate synthase